TSPPSRPSTSASAAARTEGCRAFLSALRTWSRAKFGEERIACQLGAERRLRTVARIHDGLGRKPVGKLADRRDERVPVSAGKVGASHRAGEQDVAREERSVGVVREVRR